jgi:hypothetical protein
MWNDLRGILCLVMMTGSAIAQDRMAAPDEAALAAADKVLDDIYGDQLKQARAPAENRELAAKLLEAAKSSKDGPALEFALGMRAVKLAGEARDFRIVLAANARLESRFVHDGSHGVVESLETISRGLKGTVERKTMVLQALGILQEKFAADDFAAAVRYAEFAANSGKRTGDPELAKRTEVIVAQLKSLAEEWPHIQAARERLAANPEDAADLLMIGRFYCFRKQTWEVGLPLLAKATTEPTLAALAQRDLANPTSPAEQLALGDAWWDHAAGLAEGPQAACRDRAGYWYAEAGPALTGIDKARIAKRLRELQGSGGSPFQGLGLELTSLEADAILRYSFTVTAAKTKTPRGAPAKKSTFTLQGPVEWTEEGRVGGAYRFTTNDGKGDGLVQSRLEFGGQVPGFPLQDFTMAAWVFAEANTGTIFGSGQQELWPREWFLSPEKFLWRSVAGTGSGAKGSVLHQLSYDCPLNSWQHIAVVRAGSRVTIHRNGREVAAAEDFPQLPLTLYTSGLMIGNVVADGGKYIHWKPFGGLIDEVGIWSRPLTPVELQRLYQGGRAGRALAKE